MPGHGRSKAIGLRQGGMIVAWAVVDAADFHNLNQYTWGLKDGYAQRIAKRDGRKASTRMHRVILGVADPAVHVDHIDGDRLNNRRSNLRVATARENMRNMRNSTRRKAGCLKGVKLRTDCKTRPWFSAIRAVPGSALNLGYYASEREAAMAYDIACTFLFGAFAAPNSDDREALEAAAGRVANDVDASRLDRPEERARLRSVVRSIVEDHKEEAA